MRKAFTLLELAIVILIVGILSVAIVPQMKSNKIREAATQVVSHIRYTQHLAMVDDKFDANDADWYKKRWQIIFANYIHKKPEPEYPKKVVAYSIFSDTSLSGKPDLSEMAKDTSNANEILSGGHSNLDDVNYDSLNLKLSLNQKYGIKDYKLSGGCSYSRIAFDYFGRAIKGDLSTSNAPYEDGRLIKLRCKITLIGEDANITIGIEPETGYTHIL